MSINFEDAKKKIDEYFDNVSDDQLEKDLKEAGHGFYRGIYPMKKIIRVAEDFSKYPAGRYKTDGPFSAEHLRDDFIIPALRNYEEVELYMDGVRGYSASFLEEVFGGLVRMGFSKDNIGNKLKIICKDFELVREIQTFIYDAQRGEK